MENIELVIKIPEEVYRAYEIDASLSFLSPDQKSVASHYLIAGLLTGKVLPKGHGDLIDRQELLKEPMDKANHPSNYVMAAKTIIESYKEE